ncbi:hypothetical protein KXD40_006566 [Peronospora effusa]|nr:hypothetical protein KXD40_006566 [Peronospora effusa]
MTCTQSVFGTVAAARDPNTVVSPRALPSLPCSDSRIEEDPAPTGPLCAVVPAVAADASSATAATGAAPLQSVVPATMAPGHLHVPTVRCPPEVRVGGKRRRLNEQDDPRTAVDLDVLMEGIDVELLDEFSHDVQMDDAAARPTRWGPSRRELGAIDSAQSVTGEATVPAPAVRRPLTPVVPGTRATRWGPCHRAIGVAAVAHLITGEDTTPAPPCPRHRRRRRPPRVTRNQREHRLDEALDNLAAIQRSTPGDQRAMRKARRRAGRVRAAVVKQQLRQAFAQDEAKCVEKILQSASAESAVEEHPDSCPIGRDELHRYFTGTSTAPATFDYTSASGQEFPPVLTVYAHNTAAFTCAVCAHTCRDLAALAAHRRTSHRDTCFVDHFHSGCTCGIGFRSRAAATKHAMTCTQSVFGTVAAARDPNTVVSPRALPSLPCSDSRIEEDPAPTGPLCAVVPAVAADASSATAATGAAPLQSVVPSTMAPGHLHVPTVRCPPEVRVGGKRRRLNEQDDPRTAVDLDVLMEGIDVELLDEFSHDVQMDDAAARPTRWGPSRRELGAIDSAQSVTGEATVPAPAVRRPLTPVVPGTRATRWGPCHRAIGVAAVAHLITGEDTTPAPPCPRHRRRRRPPRVTRNQREHRLDEALDNLAAIQRSTPGDQRAMRKARRRAGRVRAAVVKQQLRQAFAQDEAKCVEKILQSASAESAVEEHPDSCPIGRDELHRYFTGTSTAPATFDYTSASGQEFPPVLTVYAHNTAAFTCAVCAHTCRDLAALAAHRRTSHRDTCFVDHFHSGCTCGIGFRSRAAATKHAMTCTQSVFGTVAAARDPNTVVSPRALPSLPCSDSRIEEDPAPTGPLCAVSQQTHQAPLRLQVLPPLQSVVPATMAPGHLHVPPVRCPPEVRVGGKRRRLNEQDDPRTAVDLDVLMEGIDVALLDEFP